MAEVFDKLLVSCPNGGGMFLFSHGTVHKLDALDTTGLATRGAHVVRALQPDSLAMLGKAAHTLAGTERQFDDLHDVLLDGQDCYVANTRDNAVVKLDAAGTELRRWSFPGEPDSWHLNCLARWNGRIVFSAFSDRVGHKAYKEPPLDEGFVQDLESGTRLITGLFQPHSLVASGKHLLLANSGAFEIREYDASGRLVRKRALGGYTRGMVRHGKWLFVGLSKTRNVEVSQFATATLVALDAVSWEEVARVSLPAAEIYSVLPLRDADAIEIVARLASHATDRLTSLLDRVEGGLHEAERKMEVAQECTRRLEGQLCEKERQVFGLLETVHGKDIQIQNRDEIARQKEQEIHRRDDMLRDKEDQIQGLENQLRELDVRIQSSDETIRAREAAIGSQRAQISNLEASILDREAEQRKLAESLAAKDRELARLGERGRDMEEALSRLMAAVDARDAQIHKLLDAVNDRDRHAATLTELVSDNRKELISLREGLAVLQARTLALSSESAARERVIAAMQTSLSWRATRPLRAVRQVLSLAVAAHGFQAAARPFNKLRHVSGTLRRTLLDAELRSKYITLARVLGPRAAARHAVAYLRRGGPRVAPAIPPSVFDLRAYTGKRAAILTTGHCLFVAKSIQRALQQIGVDADVITERPANGYQDIPHFVICPQMFERLPGLYTAFQMEQSVSTRWFTPEYLRTLENSFAILDYSIANIDALVEHGLHRKQFYYLPLGYLPGYRAVPMAPGYEYDVLFYGDDHNERRRKFLDALGKVCKVKVINNLFGEDLHAEVAKARVVVNIHYYAGALLETTRLWECISLDALVVSERSSNMEENQDLESLVDFVDVDDIEDMVARVRYWLDDETARRRRIRVNRKLAAGMPNRFEYFFYRFLLAHDNIGFHQFWELAGKKLKLSGDRLCLNLPEYSLRRLSFEKDNHYGFSVFPGLRHKDGWVGCGLSYKLMIMLARQQKLPQVSICEDDVEFRDGFAEDFAEIQTELAGGHERWDVFSGLLGDLHDDAKILKVRNLRNHKFALTNRLISTVFNVYHRRVFDRISLWDDRDRDVVINTIDRYLEHTHLSVLACYPFLVGHKEELHSTLWGVQNGTMADMIQRSQQLFGSKIEAFETGAKKAEVASRPV